MPPDRPEWPADKVERWPLSRLIPYARNARTHSPEQIRQVAASMREWGWTVPVLADENGGIIAGHCRVSAAELNGYDEAPVMVARGWSDAKKRAYVLADNKLALNAEWDEELLRIEMSELQALDFDLNLIGFADEEIDNILLTDENPAEDEIPPVPAEPVTKSGDLWLLGAHRLLCGDATSAADVERVMAGRKAGLMNTDPPYGVALRLEDNHEASNSAKGVAAKYRHFEQIMGDDLDGEKLQEFLEKCFKAALPVLIPNAAWYLWHAQLTQGFFAAAAAAAQLLVHRQIIWVKPHFVFGRGDYHWQHELCFYGWVKGNRPEFYGERNQTSVWALAEGGGSIRKEQHHPAQKPVALFVIPIKNHLERDGIAFEPFGGSGSQFIAAQALGRRCYGLEISPAYCDVIVKRWQDFTGREATLEGDGRTFEEIREERLIAADAGARTM